MQRTLSEDAPTWCKDEGRRRKNKHKVVNGSALCIWKMRQHGRMKPQPQKQPKVVNSWFPSLFLEEELLLSHNSPKEEAWAYCGEMWPCCECLLLSTPLPSFCFCDALSFFFFFDEVRHCPCSVTASNVCGLFWLQLQFVSSPITQLCKSNHKQPHWHHFKHAGIASQYMWFKITILLQWLFLTFCKISITNHTSHWINTVITTPSLKTHTEKGVLYVPAEEGPVKPDFGLKTLTKRKTGRRP